MREEGRHRTAYLNNMCAHLVPSDSSDAGNTCHREKKAGLHNQSLARIISGETKSENARTSLSSDDAALHLGKRKLCAVARNDDVAVDDELEAAAVRAAVDGCNHGFRGDGPSGDVSEPMGYGGDVRDLVARALLLGGEPSGG